ncbi:hypothetical protein SAMN04488498_11653 [Mesorhizobium albiziae]|uniref:Uncharacterized protein n=1 Tax=Neomesorhizobium albiziae TaxID=335020 RepID=A0A1I4D8J6_9HYPH|nr:hypothetical protein [Mesorhizobium albiziae]GLS33620.1 hypothetical protein GCM10007937_53320 [Mesorhizobium albiziae]SFK89189.1 hypothetical protein SAMN04488498_11653 [Mesorhizobium albiziae]
MLEKLITFLVSTAAILRGDFGDWTGMIVFPNMTMAGGLLSIAARAATGSSLDRPIAALRSP